MYCPRLNPIYESLCKWPYWATFPKHVSSNTFNEILFIYASLWHLARHSISLFLLKYKQLKLLLFWIGNDLVTNGLHISAIFCIKSEERFIILQRYFFYFYPLFFFLYFCGKIPTSLISFLNSYLLFFYWMEMDRSKRNTFSGPYRSRIFFRERWSRFCADW